MMKTDTIVNVMSVDVEDYHDQLALDFQDRIVPPAEEAVRATDRVLELLAECRVQATFFILGEIAEHFPDLVRRIAAQGHHLGIHGYYHLHIYRQSPPQFRQSIERAKKLVEDIAGRTADAHRAVAFSIVESTLWALDILVDLGFKYDSSIYPFQGRRYGIPAGSRGLYQYRAADGRTLWELPMSTVTWLGRRWPVCGGGYLRHFPLWLTDSAFRRLHAEGLPAVVYLHPYEVITDPVIEPLPGMGLKQRLSYAFFNYHQRLWRKHTLSKLRRLFSRYPFSTIEQVVADLTSDPAARS
ncbi:MAG TPA: DUF3473 domain-containing protein [Phycisphaerae bacterium]|nr:DUF3473 domain-containing protein [Phycisphaerae bacterium]HRY66792.1 DUF3473 domain-containing protein [Phycisphaerae bacterium]HSA28432.1 DUF3473 domain-containing protein [Phycisphaerae bacterium]